MTTDNNYSHLTYTPSLAARFDHQVRKILGAIFCRFYPAKVALRLIEKAALAVRNCTVNYEPLAGRSKVATEHPPTVLGLPLAMKMIQRNWMLCFITGTSCVTRTLKTSPQSQLCCISVYWRRLKTC